MVRFEDLRLAFEFVSYGRRLECEAYVGRKTGAIYRRNERGEALDDLPADIGDSAEYLAIPHKDDLGLGQPLMLAFAYLHLPEDIDAVRAIFRQPNTYARFNALVERHGLFARWCEFEDNACDEMLRRWCRDVGLEVED